MREFRPGVSSLKTLLESADDSPDVTSWPLAAGDIINSDGHSGLVTIDNPFLHTRMILDMRDPLHPKRIAPLPSLRQFLVTRGFDPGRGLREFIQEFWPGISSLRVLLAL